jgi:hypothetical protein
MATRRRNAGSGGRPGGKAAAWRREVLGWEGSGLSQGDYCRRRGLVKSTFQYWRRRLGLQRARVAGSAEPGGAGAFIPVQISSKGSARGGWGWACEILGAEGVRVRLREQPGEEGLREIVAVLKGAAR